MVEPQTSSLRGLLDGLLIAHRHDIHAFSAGHLNESNLRKSEAEIHKPWKSSQKPKPVVVPASHMQHHKSSSHTPEYYESMKSTIAAFSMGADVTPRGQPQRKDKKQKRSDSETLTGSRKYDCVLVEEIHLPDVMLARTLYNRPNTWVEHDTETPIRGDQV